MMGDAGDEAFVKDYIAGRQTEFGSLDVVWANAGISGGWCRCTSRRRTTGPRSCG